MNLQLEPIFEQNIPELVSLANEIWNVYYPPIVGQEQVTYMLSKLYSREALLEQMHAKQNFYFIQKSDVNLGFVSILKIRSMEYFIHKFYVNTQMHGQGIGSVTFKKLLEKLDPVKTFHLQVNRLNFKAINFYFKLGFSIEKVIDVPIGEGFVMNDFMMVWTDTT